MISGRRTFSVNRSGRYHMEKKLRKYESNLIASGFATIIFGVWLVAKSLLGTFLITTNSEAADSLALSDDVIENHPEAFAIIILILIAILLGTLLIGVLMRVYIGRSADADAKGRKKKGWAYVVWAIILAAADIVGIAGTWMTVSRINLLSTILTSLLDLASLAALIDLIISAINVKRLRKALSATVQEI